MSIVTSYDAEGKVKVLSEQRGMIVVSAFVSETGWWMKIEHTGSDPKAGELNFSSDRVAILAEIVEQVRDAAEQEMIK